MTIHPDESRSSEQLLRQRAAELLSDPEDLVRKYEGLAARERRYKKQIAELEKSARASAREAEQRGKNAAQQTALLGSARAALDAYREENQRLKDDLQRVRGSRSMKVGKAVLSPMHSMKSVFGTAPSAPMQQSSDSEAGVVHTSAVEPASPRSAEDERGIANADDSAVSVTPVPPVDKVVELEERFAASGSASDLALLINHLWYVKGAVSSPARLLTEHAALRKEFDKKSATLAGRILGALTPTEAVALIPDRAHGPAYTAERERVMYCAHSTPMFNSNGYSTRTRGIVAGLAASGIDVTVVARSGYPWDSAADRPKPKQERHVSTLDGVQYVHLPGANLNTSPLDRYIIQGADALVREAKLLRPATIHAASNFRNALPALIAARRLGLPFVYEVRGLWEVTEASKKDGWDSTERYHAMAGLERLVAEEADIVLAITQEVADELIRRGVPEDRIRIAPNSVDSDAFLPLPPDEQYARQRKIRRDVPVIGFAGSVVDYEGLDTLLDAAKILDEQGKDFQVVIAGSGSHADQLRRTRDAEKVGNVLFTGRLPLAEMPRVYSLFDIMPCPRLSLPVTEMVSPLKPLEAFASGKAVVLSDVSPHHVLAGPEEERALLFPAGDAAALAEVLARLIDDRELRDELGRRGRRWVRTQRSWAGLGKRISSWYAEANASALARRAEDGPALDELTIGVIADEFTSKTLAGSVNAIALDRHRWQEQLETAAADAVFIESAWAGNGGQWHRGVGYYGEEENDDLFRLIAHCESAGVPTIFWNKEDPVHFNRFRLTAARCAFVFTTDADMIVPYLSTPWARTTVAASLPFYAQPAIHNPLPGRILFDDSAAYAGTYYGDRYPERSKSLASLLAAAKPYGLSIYDRQLAVPNSPYHFPREFADDVRGVLPYDQVIDSYKSHLAQLNVNSVEKSPSMYSRRVVEIPACGGLVLSGPGRGITETFGTALPATNDARNWRALLHSWSTDPVARIAESWLQYRSVMRSHTVDTELTIMFRTAGIPVRGPELGDFSVVLRPSDTDDLETLVESILDQSVLPHTVYMDVRSEDALARLEAHGIGVEPVASLPTASSTWIGVLEHAVPRTHFEDLLYAERFGEWNRIAARQAAAADRGSTIARKVRATSARCGLARTTTLDLSKSLPEQMVAHEGPIVEWVVPELATRADEALDVRDTTTVLPRTVVVAGHDLKFAERIITELKKAGHTVLIDEWQSHSDHDEEQSRALLERADIIFCEWGLGNAVWYSKHKRPNQRLVVRVHSQELRRPYLRQITAINVNEFVFVGELIKQAAVTSHGIPDSKSQVVHNFVDVLGLSAPKHPGSEKNLGLVGIIPHSKRMDRALDVLESLLESDPDYRLFIKGKGPEDYPWLKNRPEEIAYYDEQFARITAINAKHPDAVVLDGFSPDMADWYAKIGVALSVSDFESFHFTIPDGAASGAVPCSLAWPGADLLYPDDWTFDTTGDMAAAIMARASVDDRDHRSYVAEHFDGETSVSRLRDIIVGDDR